MSATYSPAIAGATWPYWSRADVRAGWADALRTNRPRILAGRRWGQLDYAAGYAFGAMWARWDR